MKTIDTTFDAIAREVARARRLLARLIRVAGLTRAKVDKILRQGRGFSTRILTGQVELKHEHILLLLTAVAVAPEDFYRILYQRPEDRSYGGTLGRLLEGLQLFDHDDEPQEDEEETEPEEVAPPAPAGFDMDGFAAQVASKVIASLLATPPADDPKPQTDEPKPPPDGAP